MLAKTQEKRLYERFPLTSYASYMRMGDSANLPDMSYSMAEILDISNGGLRMRLPQLMIIEGTLLITRVPLPGVSATIPVIARVQWVMEESERTCQAGLKFLLGN